MKKTVDLVNYEPVPESLLFLPGADRIKTAKKLDKKYDVAIIFECHGPERMGNIIDLKKQAKTVINIDHHLMHGFFGDINLVNPGASSNSEQLYYVFEKLKMPITKDEANCLYLGIMTDTGRFQHSNTNAETLRIASKLVERGANVSELSERFPVVRGM
jgi:phosphoesterase RecJ-like protein